MQIAVLIRRDHFVILGEGKYSDRLIAGLQCFALTAFLCLKDDPLNIVRLQHWMLHRTNSDGDGLSIDLHYGVLSSDDRYSIAAKCYHTHAHNASGYLGAFL